MKKLNLKEITLKEISKRANVAISTVSAVLNNSKNCFAGEKTRKKIIKIAEELGYHPNLLSRSLKNGKTNTVGLIIPHLYYSLITLDVELLESLLWEQGYHLFIGYTKNDQKKEEDLIREFLSRRVDGIIFVIGKERQNKNKEIERIIDRQYPFVTVGRFRNLRTDFVTTDFYNGGYKLAEHLYEMGYRNFGLVLGEDERYHPSIEERKKGFLDFLKKKNLAAKEYHLKDREIAKAEDYVKDGELFAEDILKNNHIPEAIFASNDELALGIVKGAIKHRIKIPDELGIAGFDNSLSSILSPIPITTMRQKKEEIAKETFAAIMRKLEGKQSRIEKFVEPELIKRVSTGIRPESLHRDNPGPVEIENNKIGGVLWERKDLH